MERNIAFKCTYNDGTKSDNNNAIGFKGTCSEEIIKWNIKRGKIWCNEGPCKNYYINDFQGVKTKLPCYESNLFNGWEYSAGWDHKNINKPRKIKQAGIGNLALLTTRFPGESEEERRIFGFYKIGEIRNNEYGKNIATKIIAGEKYRIELNKSESKKLLFWDFYSNDNSPEKAFWGTGLFRYFDFEVIDILKKANEIIENKEKANRVNDLYEYFLKVYAI